MLGIARSVFPKIVEVKSGDLRSVILFVGHVGFGIGYYELPDVRTLGIRLGIT